MLFCNQNRSEYDEFSVEIKSTLDYDEKSEMNDIEKLEILYWNGK